MNRNIIGINNQDPQYTLDVNGDIGLADNLYIKGAVDCVKVNISNIAKWVGTVHFSNNVWNVNTIYQSRITPSSITRISTGIFRISFDGPKLPIKGSDSGGQLSVGSRKYFITGIANQGSLVTNRGGDWQEDSIEYIVRSFTNSTIDGAVRLFVRILLDDVNE